VFWMAMALAVSMGTNDEQRGRIRSLIVEKLK
jgi:hypothetical protein